MERKYKLGFIGAGNMAWAIACGVIRVGLYTGPEIIVFAGGMIAAGEPLLNRIKYYFNKHIWPLKPELVDICFATLGMDAGIIGAAALALQKYNKG